MEHLTKALISAVRKGKVTEVSKLIEQGVDVNSSLTNSNGNTALHISVLLSNEQMTMILLEAGADMTLKNNLGFTPLNYGLDENHFKVAEILIKAGGDVNATNKNGERALEVAIKQKKSNITFIEYLLKDTCRSSLDNIMTVDNLPLMHLVFESKYRFGLSTTVEFIQKFVKFGFNINVKDENGDTILHKLLKDCNYHVGDLSVLRCLLKNGADPNAKNLSNGYTPLHALLKALLREQNAWKCCYEKLKLLAKYNVNFGATSNHGDTPLHLAVSYKCTYIIRFIIERGADINQINNFGLTAMDTACKKRLMNVVKLLLGYGANIDGLNALKSFSIDFLGIPGSNRYWDLMFLIQLIDVNAVDSNGKHLLSRLNSRRRRNVIWKLVIHHIALIEALDYRIDQAVCDIISKNVRFKNFFTTCQEELTRAKKTCVTGSSWVTYFHLLTGDERQLKNFVGNSNLMENLNYNKLEDLETLFPNYGIDIKKKVNDGIDMRNLFDKATIVLSREIPIFNAKSLIIHETLDCFLRKDLLRLLDYKDNSQ